MCKAGLWIRSAENVSVFAFLDAAFRRSGWKIRSSRNLLDQAVFSSGIGSSIRQDEITRQDAQFSALKSCGVLRDLEIGRLVHADVFSTAEEDIFVASSIVTMYARCGSMVEARGVFDALPIRDVVSWNALLLGYADNGEERVALDLLRAMEESEGCCCITPNATSFLAALRACISLAVKEGGKHVDGKVLKIETLEVGRIVHSRARETGIDRDMKVANTLIDFYAKCGSLVDARRIFDEMVTHSVVSWTVLMLGYAENGQGELALDCFEQMQTEDGCLPDTQTFVAALKACSAVAEEEQGCEVEGKVVKLRTLEKAMEIHAQALKSSCGWNPFVASALVDLYTNCGDLVDAFRVFDKTRFRDLVLWNAMLLGYVENGEEELALTFFETMQLRGCSPGARTYSAAIKACGSLAAKEGEAKLRWLDKGMKIHAELLKSGFDSDVFIARSLVTMYANCRSLVDARMIFDKLSHHDVISWTVIIQAYASNGEGELALECLRFIRRQGFHPSAPTLIAALKACQSSLVNLRLAKELQSEACRFGLEFDSSLATSLVDVYGKCGSMIQAQQVFDSLLDRESLRAEVAWTALLAGYSRNGEVSSVFEMFHRMREEGVEDCSAACLCVLTACGHAGMVRSGRKFFSEMKAKYGVEAGAEHYVSMVDLLGRSNELEGAVEMVRRMPLRASVVAWTSVMGACEKWRNVEVAKVAFEELVRQERGCGDAAYPYVLMAKVYRSAEMFSLCDEFNATLNNNKLTV